MVGMIGPHCPRLRSCLQWLWRLRRGIVAYIISDVSADARIPPSVTEDPVLLVSSGSAVAEAPVQLTITGDRLCICFVVPPVTASSTPESAEGEDDDVASVVSNPGLWIKLWLACPLLSMALLPSLVRCLLLRSLRCTILHLCLHCRLRLSHIIHLSVSLPRLLRHHVLVHQAVWGGGGVHCIWVTLLGTCALRFSLFTGCEPFRSII